jgi:hypothetical protein
MTGLVRRHCSRGNRLKIKTNHCGSKQATGYLGVTPGVGTAGNLITSKEPSEFIRDNLDFKLKRMK